MRALFETHFFGTVAMIKAVLPGMRDRKSGAIVNISSIGVQLTPVGSGYYSAAKAAMEGMSGALHGELAPLGISVTVVEPGAFRTDFAGRSLPQSATAIDDYADTAGRRRKENDTMHGSQAGDPVKAAAAIIAAVEANEPPLSCCWVRTPCSPIDSLPSGAKGNHEMGRAHRRHKFRRPTGAVTDRPPPRGDDRQLSHRVHEWSGDGGAGCRVRHGPNRGIRVLCATHDNRSPAPNVVVMQSLPNLVDSAVGRAAIQLAKSTESTSVFNHSVRSYLFGELLAAHDGIRPHRLRQRDFVFGLRTARCRRRQCRCRQSALRNRRR